MPWKNAPYWLVPVTCSFLYYTTQDHQPRSGTTLDGLAPPTSITSKVPHKLPIGQFYGSIFSVVILISQICLFFFLSVDKKINQDVTYLINIYYLPQFLVSSYVIFLNSFPKHIFRNVAVTESSPMNLLGFTLTSSVSQLYLNHS